MMRWDTLLNRFPGLRPLLRAGVPFQAQTMPGDCGSACVAMLACHYGRVTTVSDVNALTGSSRLGLRMSDMLAATRTLGFDGRIVKLHELDDLRWLDRPVVLHWGFSHFVVLESFDGKNAWILDPAQGRRQVDRTELGASYTGIMLWLDAPAAVCAKVPPRPLLPFLRSFIGWLPELSGLLALFVALQLLTLAPSLISAYMFGTLLPQHESGLFQALAMGMFAIAMVQPLCDLARNHLIVEVRAVLGLRMLGELVDRIFRIHWRELQQRSYGDLLTRIHANEEIRNLVTGTGLALLLDALLSILGWILLIAISPKAAGLALLVSIVAGAIFGTLRRRRERELHRMFASQSQAQGFLVQILMGMESVRAGGLSRGVREHWSKLFAQETAGAVAIGRTEGRISSINNALVYAGGLLMMIFVGQQVLAGSLDLTGGLLVYSLTMTLLGTTGRMFLGVQHLQSVRFQAGLAQDLLDLPCEPPPERTAAKPKANGALRCQGVRFSYASNAPLSLADINLQVSAGALVAIVGASGSGKSTLLTLLAGLYEPQSGDVELDGRALTSFTVEHLRRQIVLVPQFPYFFAASIRENLQLASADASPTRLRQAAQQACIADDIEALPMAYETVLAEGGAGFSGGQRQRLALARAILVDPAVLLLDEATSSLDARSEQAVLDQLARLRCTRIIAAHRLSTVRAADYIYVLEDGRIVQHGRYCELTRQPGAFCNLFGRQLNGAVFFAESDTDAGSSHERK